MRKLWSFGLSKWKNLKNIALNLEVEEGKKYYFGDIRFIGNSIYTDKLLKQYLGIKKTWIQSTMILLITIT